MLWNLLLYFSKLILDDVTNMLYFYNSLLLIDSKNDGWILHQKQLKEQKELKIFERCIFEVIFWKFDRNFLYLY